MITIQQFNEIVEMDTKDPNYDYQVISMVFGFSLEEIGELSIDDLIKYQKKISQWMEIRKAGPNTKWCKNSLIFNINNLTFGEYVDLESFIKIKKYNEFLNIFFKLDIDFNDAPVTILFNALDIFNEYQQNLFKSYETIFQFDDEDEEDEEERFISPKRTAINTKEQQMAAKQKKWGWYSVAFSLAKNDITKIDEVFNQPLIKVLNILTMVKDLQIELNVGAYPLY
jgi:hypothetical protein